MSHSYRSGRVSEFRKPERRNRRTHGASDDVGDLHEPVIDHVGKVVGREAVTLPDDKVLFVLAFSVALVDEIGDFSRRLRRLPGLESNGKRLATGGPLLGHIVRKTPTGPGIVDGLSLVDGRDLVHLEVFGLAETSVRFSFLDQLVNVLIIHREAVRLFDLSEATSGAVSMWEHQCHSYLFIRAKVALDIGA
jgi:hypothetical protein